MKKEKVMLMGAVVVGTVGVLLLLLKLRSKKEPDRYRDDFAEDSHVVKRFRVTDEETKRFFDEIFGDSTEDEDE